MCPVVRRESDQRRFVALLGVSLLVHAGLLWWFASIENEPPIARHKAIEMEFVSLAPEPVIEPPQPTVAPQPVTPPRADPKKKVKNEAFVAPAAPSSGETGSNGPVADTGPSVGTRGDLPLAVRPNLLPSSGFSMQLGTGGLSEATRGTTVRNGPGEAPDQRSLDEYTGEVLTRRLNTDLQQEVGLAAVAVGNVPTHFKRYEQAMRTALPKANIDVTPMKARDTIADVAGILFNNGPSAEAQKKVADSALGRSVQQQNVMMPNVEDQRAREGALQQMAQFENLKERITRQRLRTVLEVTTDATGALADVSIVEKSGDPRFDESVMHFSRKVARAIPDTDDKLLGTSMWRTRWQFTWEPPDVRVRLLNAWRVASGPAAQ